MLKHKSPEIKSKSQFVLNKRFKNFTEFKQTVLDDIYNKVSQNLKFDIHRASQSTWNAMTSIPTSITEPIFEEIFNIKIELPSTVEMANIAVEQRNIAYSELTVDVVNDYLLGIDTQWVFDRLDEIFMIDKTKPFVPVDPQVAADALPKSTSSSFPYFVKKYEVLDKVVSQVRLIIATADFSWMHFPAVVRWRTQQRKSGTKYRQFYMFSYLILVLEMIYFCPIFNHFHIYKDTAYCFGMVYHDLKPRVMKLKKRNKYVYSLDYKSFDRRTIQFLIWIAFKYWRSRISINNWVLDQLFQKLVSYASYCTVASALNGEPILFSKKRGIMSGSVITNLIGTTVNAIMILLYCKSQGIWIEKDDFLLLGDDCLFGMDKLILLDDIHSFMLEKFDAEISLEKSLIYDFSSSKQGTVFFLGYEIDENGRYLDPELAKQQLCVSETFISEDVLPTKTRLFSKLASLVFKCKDGWIFWDKYAPLLARKLECEIPEYFVQIYFTANETIDYKTQLSIRDYKYNGWVIQ